MAFENVTLTDSVPTNFVYEMVGPVGPDGRVIRKHLASAIETPLILTTGHTTNGKSSNAVDRHLSRLDETVLDADGITPYVGSVYLVCTVPRRAITSTIMWNLYKQLTSRFTTEASFQAFLQGKA